MLNSGIVLLIAGFILLQALSLIIPANMVPTYSSAGGIQVQTGQTDANATLREIAGIVFSAFELIGVILMGYAFLQPHLESA